MTLVHDCPLCGADALAPVVWEDRELRVIRVDDAAYPGFCRVIWKKHVVELTDLDAAQRVHLMDVVCAVEQTVRDVMQCDKVNLASFGNQAPHLHWHVIPRFTDDLHFPQAIWATPVRPDQPSPFRAERRARADSLTGALKRGLDAAFAASL